MKKWCIAMLVWCVAWSLSALSAHAMGGHQPALGQRALMLAMTSLSASPADEGLALVTNAGYVEHQGQPTGEILDTVTRLSAMGRGKGNLLSVHARRDAPLFMVFVHQKGPRELAAVSITATGNQLEASEVFNLWVGVGTSFEPFTRILGSRAFAVATLANACYDGIPESLVQAALFHDHFCCGVASGYFTAGFILDQRPLRDGESYTYMGIPAWCQDDYITHALNLTPGKRRYLSMAYPSRRPWQTEEATWENIGGVIIRFNKATQKGDATVLSYRWQTNDFVESLGLSPDELDWHKDLWLHACYNRYVFQNPHAPEDFLSVHKTVELTSQADFDRLTRLGANPLAVILGNDIEW
ncbi:FmdE family protein [Desulfoluna butyratoxydans]|uniref:Formylmethanofuran dehydrogenase subunit e domain n=1 Tax=Desulfoluna butyratoxydans TaxID=231438 RepID=A0A4U8YLQ0_9BACT|nr:FmdE family protein [Desulfoluna butyratoxydans]VFQ44651.1 formylmethanofuran dehydrogenase subunit e domain [Desulfoluna butyratoxydans]